MNLGRLRNSKAVSALAPRAGGLLDQAFFSGIYFIQTAFYARHLSTAEFGAFSLFYYTLVLIISVQRAVIVTPMIVSTPPDDFRLVRTWRSGAVFLSACIACLLLLAFLYDWATTGGFRHATLLYCALGTMPLLAFEFHRRSLFLQRRPLAAATSSALFFLLQGCGTVGAILFKAGLPAIVAIYVVNSIIAAAFATWLSMKPVGRKDSRFVELVSDHRGLVAWNLASLAPYMVYNNAMPMIISALFGLREAALYSATRVLVAPITMLVSAVDSTDKPRAARALQMEGVPGLFRSLRKTAITLLALAAPYLLILVLFPHQILTLAVGRKYADHVELIPYWVAIAFLFLLGQPLESGLVVLRRSDLFFWSRTLAAVLTLTLMALKRGGAGALAGVSSTSWAWGASTLLTVILMIHIANRRRQPPTA
jgi:O-antigen/teichoic acid export membrane protein